MCTFTVTQVITLDIHVHVITCIVHQVHVCEHTCTVHCSVHLYVAKNMINNLHIFNLYVLYVRVHAVFMNILHDIGN